MADSYNDIAGRSVSRLASLSDGVFAVAMTLMVFDLHAPAVNTIHSESDLWQAVVVSGPRLLMYVMSFLTLGIFWVGQQTQLNHLEQSSRGLSWIHIGFLFTISMMPFSTTLLAQFPTYRVALLCYWFNILMAGVALYFSWICAARGGLVKKDVPPHFSEVIEKRIILAQSLYGFAALLCVFSTYWSIGLMVAVQLTYAIHPGIQRGKK